MTTHLAISGNIAQYQMDVVLSMLRSWDIDAKVEKIEQKASKTWESPVSLPFSAGMWADYDIDDQTLRAKAWKTHKKQHSDTL